MPRPLRIRVKRCRTLYIRLLFCILGRAIPRAIQLSREAKEECRKFPSDFRILLGLRAPGPALILESDGLGRLYRAGWRFRVAAHSIVILRRVDG